MREPGPITAEEKELRRANGLCLYCGGAGHVIGDCPKRKVAEAKREQFARDGPANPPKA